MAKPYVRWLLGLGWLRRASRFCFFVSAQTQEHRVLLLLLGLCVWRERGGGLTAQLPNGTLLQGNLLLHPDFSKM